MTPTPKPPSRAVLVIVAAIVWVIDQATKALVVRNLELGEVWAPFPSLAQFFTFTHTTNTGAAFGLFPDAGWFFVVVAIIVVSGILIFYRHLPTDRWLVRVSLGLQLGGALGNLTDRLTRGAVVDFFDFKVWPVFNIADSSIVVGVAILAYYLIREDMEPRPGGQASRPVDPDGSLPSNAETDR